MKDDNLPQERGKEEKEVSTELFRVKKVAAKLRVGDPEEKKRQEDKRYRSNDDLPEDVQEKLREIGWVLPFRTGDMVIGNRGSKYKVGEITIKGFVLLYFRRYSNEKEKEWHHYGTIEWNRRERKEYIKINKPMSEIIDDTLKNAVQIIDDYEKNKLQLNTDPSKSREMITSDKALLDAHKDGLQEGMEKLMVMKRALDIVKSNFEAMIRDFEKKIKKIKRVIGQIELYLGIDEDIVQIQEGPNASDDVVIGLRQKILYMDEEVGVFEAMKVDSEWQGIDWEEIDKFDDWVLDNQNYKWIIPEEKGIVVFRVRREKKEYIKVINLVTAMINAKLNIDNFKTYLLIRNGDNIYRIWGKVRIEPRLFPMREEVVIGKEHRFESDKEKLENIIFDYTQNILFIQGLLDRTPIFHPLKKKVNLFKPDECDGVVKFIRDEEDGILTYNYVNYKEWHKEINLQIKVGTRICLTGFIEESYGSGRSSFKDRFPYQYKNTCKRPNEGIYNIKRIEMIDSHWRGEYERLVCHHNPKDTVYAGWYDWRSHDHERKNAMPFYVYRDDEFILNYDMVNLEIIDYFMTDRNQRANYLDVLPAMFEMRKHLLEEKKWEDGMIKTVMLELGCNEYIIRDCIEWWKKKVIMKRALTEDDSKAWRMIKGRVKRKIQESKRIKIYDEEVFEI